MTDVDRFRADLPAARAAVYLNTGTFGPLPTPVYAAVRGYLDEAYERGRLGTRAYALWMELTQGAREAFARALRAEPGAVAVTASTTDGVDLVLQGTAWAAGDDVLTTDTEHPGLTTPLRLLTERWGVVVRTLPAHPVATLPERIAAAAGERTRMAALSHVLWTTGAVVDAAALATLLERRGVRVLLDGAQALGAIPLEVARTGVSYYAVPGQKWLCGPSGTGALWVRPDRLDDLTPAWPWYGTDDHEAPDGTLWADARRLDAGAVSLGALAGVAAAVAWREDLGWDASLARGAALTAALVARLGERDHVRLAPDTGHGPLVAWEVEGHDPKELSERLEAAGVLVRYLPGTPWLRASVGPWNTDEDLDRLLAAVDAAAG